MSKPRRTKRFIDSRVQGALARRIIAHWLLFVGVGCLVAFVLQVLSNPFRPISEHVRDMWWTHGPFLLVLVFLMPVFVVDTIKLSHRFAGPIFALRRAIRNVAEGGVVKPLRFRKRDFWHDLADDWNTMLRNTGLLKSESNAPRHTEQQEVAASQH